MHVVCKFLNENSYIYVEWSHASIILYRFSFNNFDLFSWYLGTILTTLGVAPEEGEGLWLELGKVRLLPRAVPWCTWRSGRWFASVAQRLPYGLVQLVKSSFFSRTISVAFVILFGIITIAKFYSKKLPEVMQCCSLHAMQNKIEEPMHPFMFP